MSKAKELVNKLEEGFDGSVLKGLIKEFRANYDEKVAKQITKEMTKANKEVFKSFKKSLTSFLKQESKRLEKEFPELSVKVEMMQGTSYSTDAKGNADSRFGSWIAPELQYMVSPK